MKSITDIPLPVSPFQALAQQEPPFPPEMSPTSPLLSPQNSTPQTPLLQQAPPPGYQSADTKGWPAAGLTSNRCNNRPVSLVNPIMLRFHVHAVTLPCLN